MNHAPGSPFLCFQTVLTRFKVCGAEGRTENATHREITPNETNEQGESLKNGLFGGGSGLAHTMETLL